MDSMLKLAEQLKGNVKAPNVSEKVDPVEKKTRAAYMLEELEEKCGFNRSEPSMEFKGSDKNEQYVREKIYYKYGEEEAVNYVACVQVKPKTEWLKQGFVPKEGEEPLCFIISNIKGQHRNVALWHIRQVEKA